MWNYFVLFTVLSLALTILAPHHYCSNGLKASKRGRGARASLSSALSHWEKILLRTADGSQERESAIAEIDLLGAGYDFWDRIHYYASSSTMGSDKLRAISVQKMIEVQRRPNAEP